VIVRHQHRRRVERQRVGDDLAQRQIHRIGTFVRDVPHAEQPPVPAQLGKARRFRPRLRQLREQCAGGGEIADAGGGAEGLHDASVPPRSREPKHKSIRFGGPNRSNAG